MPDGLVTLVDPSTGEARIARARRQYVARIAEVEPQARHVGARVHFDIRRESGAEMAVHVELSPGRSSAHHHGAGRLTGAHRPDTKGPAPFARPHPEFGLALAGHPFQAAGAWARAVAAGSVDEALAFYPPDASLHIDGDALRSRRHIRACLENLAVLGCGRPATVRNGDGHVLVRWEARSPADTATDVRCRVEHGLIAEQWIGTPGAELTSTPVETPLGAVTLATLTQGDVPSTAVAYGRERIGALTKLVDEPILFVRLKLTMAADPAVARPAMAEAVFEINGLPVRAHVAGHDLREAIDLLQRRLADKLHHRAQRLDALRRHSPGVGDPGEWRHGNLPPTRPDYFDRPVEDRQLMRHKAFMTAGETIDEVIFDMEQSDYDFALFHELATDEDGAVEHVTGDSYRLRRLSRMVEPRPESIHEVAVEPSGAPTLTVDEAIDILNLSADRFVFFRSPATGRGALVYRRYDGHYGLLTLEPR